MRKTAVPKKSSNPILAFGLFLILIGALAVFLLPRTAKAFLSARLSRTIGLPVEIRELNFSLTPSQFSMKDLRFLNPPGFPPTELAAIKEVKALYSFSPVTVGRLSLKKVEVDFKELRLIRNKTGRLNLPEPPKVLAGGLIDEVILNLGPVTYTDLSEGQPVQKTFDLGLRNALYRNVKGVVGILEIVNWEALKRTGVEAEAPVIPEIKPIPSPAPSPAAAPSVAPPPPAKPSPKS